MPAIITNAFRTYNADNFISSFSTNKMYLMIGKADSWSGVSAGQYTEGSPSDTAIPTPIDTTVAPFIHHNDMIAAKLINTSDVSHVVKRTDWTSGTVYTEYNHLQDDQIDQTFFVMTDQYNIYKCISNYGGIASTVKPTGQSAAIIETSDNYRWKFMYEVQQADVLKYVTTDWIPIKYLTSNDGTAQWTVQQAAVDGALEHIDVTAGGTGYTNTHTGTAQAGAATTITLAATASVTDDVYNSMTVYISSGTGSGQIKVITDYVGSTKVATVSAWTTQPDTTSVYEIMPAVAITTTEGTGAAARCSSVVGGIIKKIAMTAVGTGYRSGTATLTGGGGTGCTLEPRIGPKNGHGKNPKTELGGAYVMMNVRLVGTEGGDFVVGDDFRKVVLIANPNVSGSAATASTYSGAEMDDDSGEQIYIEYRAPINRASDQTEDVKLVVEF
tara:strand:+ start:683 stop:2008 length:1326 start_codon:yes stop_codon:yes gene_type:complete